MSINYHYHNGMCHTSISSNGGGSGGSSSGGSSYSGSSSSNSSSSSYLYSNQDSLYALRVRQMCEAEMAGGDYGNKDLYKAACKVVHAKNPK